MAEGGEKDEWGLRREWRKRGAWNCLLGYIRRMNEKERERKVGELGN